MHRAIVLALALAGGAAVAAAVWFARSEIYYPVARVATPEGLTFTAFSSKTRWRSECNDANERFLEPLRKECPACEVLSARCESKDEMMKLRIALTGPQVRSRGLTLALAGPRELSLASCEFLAKHLLRQGLDDSRCIPPRS